MKVPLIIYINIFNKILECEDKKTSFFFYKYFIGCVSLVCKDFNEKVAPKLAYKSFCLDSVKQTELILKWFRRGIKNLDIYHKYDCLKSELINYYLGSDFHLKEKSSFDTNKIDFLIKYLECRNRDTKSKIPLIIDRDYFLSNLPLVKLAVSQKDQFTITYEEDCQFEIDKEQYTASLPLFLDRFTPFHQYIQHKKLKHLVLDSNSYTMDDLNYSLKEYRIKELTLNRLKTFRIGNFEPCKLQKLTLSNTIEKISQQQLDSLIILCSNLESLSITSEYTGTTLLTESLVNSKIKNIYFTMSTHSEPFPNLIEFLNSNKHCLDITLNCSFSKTPFKSERRPCITNTTLKRYNIKDILDLWSVESALTSIPVLDICDQLAVKRIVKFHPNIEYIKVRQSEYRNNKTNIVGLIKANLLKLKSLNLYLITHGESSFDIMKSFEFNTTITELTINYLVTPAACYIITMNIPNLKSFTVLSGCSFEVLTGFKKNNYLTSVEITIESIKQDLISRFLEVFSDFLTSNNSITRFTLSYNYSYQELHTKQMYELLQNYYKTHPNPIGPQNLKVGCDALKLFYLNQS